ncbi:MAG: tripartite tricarboxylate transporter substrate binding protein [Betaproteobacteria bacterium]|nr:tripartite tricarboxylate transporter substrate binding protein [Betaproteobacteria bacterium]
MFTLRKLYRLLSVLVGMALCPAASYGQASALPNKPVRLIVPFSAAGPNDFAGRMIAPKLSETLGQNVIVDNRPSANGVIGSELVARAAADGSVLSVGNSGTHAINATLYRNPTYDPVRDFAPISEVVSSSLVLVAHPSVPANNIRELIAEAKRAPGKLNIAIGGPAGEIAGNMIKLQANIELNNVPYKGGAPAATAVASNESQLMPTLYSSVAALLDAGKVKPIGVTGLRRDPQLPKVPTLAESGLDGYQLEFWIGILAPAKTPAATVQALSREIARIVNLPEVKERFVTAGYAVVGSTPEQFAERVRRDTEKYRRIIIESGMQQL